MRPRWIETTSGWHQCKGDLLRLAAQVEGSWGSPGPQKEAGWSELDLRVDGSCGASIDELVFTSLLER